MRTMLACFLLLAAAPAALAQKAAPDVTPQIGHGLAGTNYGVDGEGRTIAAAAIPNRYDQLALLFDWVEKGMAPGMSVTVTAGEKSLPACSYPTYPRYQTGAATDASSYRCSQP